ncbi:MAG TPA: PQQ-dependent sugar dehydrogenase [Nitrospirales bacterium]|nr:PQQ-dependent sugar dehydrogenase [Nitrospirales bacterium]
MTRYAQVAWIAVLAASLAACFELSGSHGGGQTTFSGTRALNPADIAVPDGYRIDVVATGLTFPTGIAFDASGNAYVTESGYAYGEVTTVPRLLRLKPDGRHDVIVTGGKNGPWNGVAFHHGALFIAEGGQFEGGRLLKVTSEGAVTVLVDDLPSLGDHHTDGPVIGPDGWVYFGQGTATNSGVVGEDNKKFGWVARFPDFHDTPCRDLTLTGQNFNGTGAYSPLGTISQPGQVIAGRVPCNGAVFRVRPDGGSAELVAWGFRNPYGLAFSPDGRLFLTENGYDDRGSRPVHGAGDVLWAVTPGLWYGWPDFHAGKPLNLGDHYVPPGKRKPIPLLASYPNAPPEPVAVLGVHASANGFDFSRDAAFGFVGEAFIAEFGDMAPAVGKVLAPVGFRVVRVDRGGAIHDFAVNRGKQTAPASLLGHGGLERPIAARFDASGRTLYVVDFGVMTVAKKGPEPRPGTGVVWKITRTR